MVPKEHSSLFGGFGARNARVAAVRLSEAGKKSKDAKKKKGASKKLAIHQRASR